MDHTALHGACIIRNAEMISLLLSRGAYISSETNRGGTPFQFLLDEEFEEIKYEPGCKDKCIFVMLKEFSKLTFENFDASEVDKKLMKIFPAFKNCIKELGRM